MAEEKITFTSNGLKIAGTVRVPAGVAPNERRPAFMVLHGFGSNSGSNNVLEPCAMFEKLGYVTLRFSNLRWVVHATSGHTKTQNCQNSPPLMGTVLRAIIRLLTAINGQRCWRFTLFSV